VSRGRPPSGSYLVFLTLRRPETVQAAGRGWHLFPGAFVYAGSARGALFPRIFRHLKSRKKIRWHLDHLTSREGVDIPLVLCTSRPEWTECRLVREIGALWPAARAVGQVGIPTPRIWLYNRNVIVYIQTLRRRLIVADAGSSVGVLLDHASSGLRRVRQPCPSARTEPQSLVAESPAGGDGLLVRAGLPRQADRQR
jgi:Uri superfamily endonuclease